jgi:cytochrome c
MRLPATLLLFAALAAAAPARADDPWRGWETYRQQCMACHEVGPGARHNNRAPQLNAIVGRVAGGSAGYPFSNALRNAQITWDEANMVQFLTDPQTIMPGNRHTGVRAVSVQEAENIIAYLKRFGGDGALR